VRHDLSSRAALRRPTLDSEPGPRSADSFAWLDRAAKRVLDVTVASALLLLLSPLILCVSLAIAADSRGGILYRCARIGQNGQPMLMLKFRKMHDGASGVALTVVDDQRFTRTGRFLARTKLDEIPQLWNVLRGEMSLVGPRPEDPGFVERCPDDFADNLLAKPGITGLCQLAYARESEVLDPENRVEDYVVRLLPNKLALDRLYVQNRSLLMDLRILSWTAIAVVLRRDVAVHRSTGGLSLRRRQTRFADAEEARTA
jgi:lipopolysaccharide/colanic/teichoic acid biosynthesis glycosyltransferase